MIKTPEQVQSIISKRVADNVRSIFKERKISQVSAAKEMQVSAVHVSYVLNGKRPVTMPFLASLASFLGVDVCDLIEK